MLAKPICSWAPTSVGEAKGKNLMILSIQSNLLNLESLELEVLF